MWIQVKFSKMAPTQANELVRSAFAKAVFPSESIQRIGVFSTVGLVRRTEAVNFDPFGDAESIAGSVLPITLPRKIDQDKPWSLESSLS